MPEINAFFPRPSFRQQFVAGLDQFRRPPAAIFDEERMLSRRANLLVVDDEPQNLRRVAQRGEHRPNLYRRIGMMLVAGEDEIADAQVLDALAAIRRPNRRPRREAGVDPFGGSTEALVWLRAESVLRFNKGLHCEIKLNNPRLAISTRIDFEGEPVALLVDLCQLLISDHDLRDKIVPIWRTSQPDTNCLIHCESSVFTP